MVLKCPRWLPLILKDSHPVTFHLHPPAVQKCIFAIRGNNMQNTDNMTLYMCACLKYHGFVYKTSYATIETMPRTGLSVAVQSLLFASISQLCSVVYYKPFPVIPIELANLNFIYSTLKTTNSLYTVVQQMFKERKLSGKWNMFWYRTKLTQTNE